MKKNILFKGFLLSILCLNFSCEDFLEGTNENPNDPVAVSPAALLTPAELTLAYEVNANFSRWSGIFVQHVEGVARQQAGFNSYNFAGSNFSTDWSNLYVDVLQNLNIMIDNSTENGYNHYVGAGQTLKAYTLMLMTDYWDDIPYSEAFQGIEGLQPTFDSQASIYTEVHSLLASARSNLASGNGGLPMGGDDNIYGGDTAQWIKAAHAIDARAYLHQGLLSGSNYTAAIASIDQAFTSSADDMAFKFGSAATTASPWYQFNRDRGDIGFNSTFGDALAAANDPRLDKYDGDGDALFGDVLDTHEVFVIDQPVDLVTFTELMFAKAEALIASGGSQGDISAAYLAGIESSFASLGLEAEYAAYIAQPSITPATITLNEVMTQKWFALYANPESFSDWRRTGIPALTPNNGVAVPTRWLYPQTEIELNSNTPEKTLTDNVAWDTN